MFKKRLTLIFLTTLTLTYLQSCDSTEPDDNRKLTLNVEDVSSTEVRLKLTTTEIPLPANISITKNSNFAKLITLKSNDSLFTIDSLQPSTSYSMEAIYDGVKSDPVTAVTMDTTTQNFTFETVEFGDGFSSSYFNDVWIFDENNIWAVGEVLLDDGYTNIMRWNGTEWIPKRPYLTSSGISGIWAFDSSNIYFSSGAIRKYESGQFIVYSLSHLGFTNTQGVHKLWGSSESNIWGVGPWGTIVHYDGNGWAKIEFDRQWYFYNITGSTESGIGYAVARNNNDDCIISELKDNQAKIIYNSSGHLLQLKSWTIDYHKQILYLAGADTRSVKIWGFNLTSNKQMVLIDLEGMIIETDIRQITVNNASDIYLIGKNWDIGKMIHYNGISYTGFADDFKALINYGDASSINNHCVSVGAINNKAYITKIKRN